jgi:hypothetical protein
MNVSLKLVITRLQLIERSSKRVVGIDQLTPLELEWFSDAVDVARRAATEQGHFFHCEPVRDADSRFCKLRVRDGTDAKRVLVVIPIDKKGLPQAAETDV